MMNSSVDVLSSQLKPLCSRDNHVMKYESPLWGKIPGA
jgi:hypothetical protein